MSLAKEQISLNKDDRDSISNMPDDILIKILSLLNTKSAISTSILSKRWKHLYHSLTHLILTLERPNFSHRDEKMTQFTKTIQNLLVPNTKPNIRSLFINFRYFHASHKPLLDECILNVFSGKLEHFKFILSSLIDRDKYKFPLDSLDGLGNSLQILHICGCVLLPQPGYLAFASLKRLTLTGVIFYEIKDVKGYEEFDELIEERFHILINGCLNLEILSIIICEFEGVMRIDAPFSHLKEIKFDCCYCEGIEIVSAPKLQSLDIYNSFVVMDTNPNIKYLRFGFGYIVATYRLDHISSIFPCLQTLVLRFPDKKVWLEPVRCSASLMKLKHLVIEALFLESCSPEICNPLWIALILEAAPFLETFEINIEKKKIPELFEEVVEPPEPFNFQHKNLKEFEMKGFKGGPMEKAVVRFVMDSATALGKIVLCNDEGYYEEFDATKFSSVFE
ncbi:hypothetical protein LUZ60_006654 [Juncus effusus]|nr:hypothetical protein LUZ60_006654 [Juncus effusus]